MQQSRYILDNFAEELKDIASIDKPSKVEGRSLVMFLTAKK
jgi:translation initiation factor IF-3